MPDLALTATIHSSISEIAPESWNALVPHQGMRADSPFAKHQFFKALEDSGCATVETGWMPQHITIARGDDIIAAMPLYLKSHSQGEYVFDYGWADAFERAGGSYYPKLQCSVPFTPASASKLLVLDGDVELKHLLLDTATRRAQQIGASSVHATFVSESDANLAVEDGWLLRNDTQFHWSNPGYADFDGFLQQLASRKRKTLRKERDSVRDYGVTVRWIEGKNITEADWDQFFTFYMDTGSRKWGHPYLNRTFFSLLHEAMADDVVLMFADLDGETIAGTLNFVGSETLYGRYWGCTRHVPFLHFELCYYQAIDYAIAHQLKRVEAGAQGEHKLARGYAPRPTHSVHWIAHSGFRKAVADYLEDERAMVERNQDILSDHAPYRKTGPSSDSE